MEERDAATQELWVGKGQHVPPHVGVEREKGLVPKISFGLLFRPTLSFTRAMAVTQKVHSKNKSFLLDTQEYATDGTAPEFCR